MTRALNGEWEEQLILMAILGLNESNPDRALDGVRILELANEAYFLYVRQNSMEKTKSRRVAVSNCRVDAASAHPPLENRLT